MRVVREGDAYYLTAPEIDNPPQGATFYEVAEQLVVKLKAESILKDADC